ncbi:MAG TPA: hypothetical protein VME17_14975 [Bryobacteraceae bacterium]|nr:hypothetical protein [Bryobacteraceae bacterium]
MASYLEAYGAAEQHRARILGIIKYCVIALVAALVAGLILFAVFRNHSEEQRAKTFVGLLQAHNYQAAYAMWGCTENHPCIEYSFNKFLEDWGPKSAHANAPAAMTIGLSQSCGSGVVIRLDYKNPPDMVPLWVERDSGVISFAPWAECPGRHLHFGAWLKSVFGGSGS